MMDAAVEPINTFASRIRCYHTVTIVSCGAAGCCCQVAEQRAIPGKIQKALDAFEAKYPKIKGSMSFGCLVFKTASRRGGGAAAQAAPAQQARDRARARTVRRGGVELRPRRAALARGCA